MHFLEKQNVNCSHIQALSNKRTAPLSKILQENFSSGRGSLTALNALTIILTCIFSFTEAQDIARTLSSTDLYTYFEPLTIIWYPTEVRLGDQHSNRAMEAGVLNKSMVGSLNS